MPACRTGEALIVGAVFLTGQAALAQLVEHIIRNDGVTVFEVL